MVLQPQKCMLIPTNTAYSDEVAQSLRDWLSRHLPDWASFSITDCGEYLGIYVGPGSSNHQWSAPIAKFTKKAANVASASSGPFVSAYQYNVTSVPTLGYVGQLVPPPKGLYNLERKVLTHLLHIPTGAVDGHSFFAFHTLNGPSIVSVQASLFAAAFRTATRTCDTWGSWAATLNKVAFDEGYATLHSLGTGRLHPHHWGAPPIVMYFTNLLSLESGNPLVDLALERCVAELSMPKKNGTDISVQKLAYAHLKLTLYDNTLERIITTRLSTLFPAERNFFDQLDFDIIAGSLKKLNTYFAFSVVKTMINGWTTSARYHDGVASSCVFGCRYKKKTDCISHYMCCPNLRRHISPIFGGPSGEGVADRLGLVLCSPRLFSDFRWCTHCIIVQKTHYVPGVRH